METKTEKVDLGNGFEALVDTDLVPVLKKFSWRAVKSRVNYYAKATIISNGKKLEISMHRFIAHCPRHCIVHHRNFDSLDNRRENLLIMSKQEHADFHSLNNISIKFARNSPEFIAKK